jgi:shikimate kinase
VIVLIGPKHSGKTSVGRELARLLAFPFYDLDAFIEESTGRSVRSLYSAGPELFRHAEEAALEALLFLPEGRTNQSEGNAGVLTTGGIDSTNGILATGGGIIDNPGALALFGKGSVQEESRHTIVCLDVPVQTAWQRITSAGELPPFLRAETMDASMEKHRLLHQRRSDACRKFSQFCVPVGEKLPGELAAEICGMIGAEKNTGRYISGT